VIEARRGKKIVCESPVVVFHSPDQHFFVGQKPLALIILPDRMVIIPQFEGEHRRNGLAALFKGIDYLGWVEVYRIAGLRGSEAEHFQILPLRQVDKAIKKMHRRLRVSVQGQAYFFREQEGIVVLRIGLGQGDPGAFPFPLGGEFLGVDYNRLVLFRGIAEQGVEGGFGAPGQGLGEIRRLRGNLWLLHSLHRALALFDRSPGIRDLLRSLACLRENRCSGQKQGKGQKKSQGRRRVLENDAH